MARKRITEDDILQFRQQADELHRELEIKYDNIEKSKKPVEDTEERDTGILLLYGPDTDEGCIRRFSVAAKRAGYAVETVDVSVKPDECAAKVRIPGWQSQLDLAQSGYVLICERTRRVAVMGAGNATPAATVLAEQYPVDALILVGEGPQVRPFTADRTLARLSTLARNNLFSIVCPVYAITPGVPGQFRSGAAKLFETSSRSDDVRVEMESGLSAQQIWTEREQALEKRIFGYLEQL